jgi:hypothetical protein
MAKVALLIGVSEYEVGLNPLPAAVKDVVALERVLRDSEMGDFDEVKILTNPEPQAMQYEVETLFSGRSKDDFVLLFFSGHGIKDDSNNLYFATRITKKSAKGDLIRSTAVPARFVHEVMNNSRAKRQAIILDCCFSGAFDPNLLSKDDGSVDLQGQLGAEGRVVLTSSSSTQYSFEQQGSDLSLYTRYLIEGIETGAGDIDEDGKISVRELHGYATSKVQETAPNMTPKLIILKDMGLDIVLAKAKVTDPKLRYRRLVEKYSSRGSISSTGRMILNTQQKQLGLSVEVSIEIETEVLRPYQERLENLQRYKEGFSQAVKNQYPLSHHDQSELEDLLDVWGLRREDVDAIEQEIIAQAAQSSEAALEEYQRNLQRYEQDFRRAVEAEYPLNDHVRNGLNDFQQSLGLRKEDIDLVEYPIITQKEAEKLQQKQEQDQLRKLEYQDNLQRYEQEFRRAVEAEYPLNTYVRKGLNDFQHSLGLNSKDVEQLERPILAQKYQQNLEAEELKQKQEREKLKQEQEKLEYQRNLLRYEQEFCRSLEAGYPFSDYVRNGLKDFQKSLGLQAKDIDLLERPFIAVKEAERKQKLEAEQQKKKQEQDKLKREQEKIEYQRKLQRYEQDFCRAIDAEYPLSDYVRNGLKDFQQSLSLKSEDVEQIERPLLAVKESEYRQWLETQQRKKRQEQDNLESEQENLKYQQNAQKEDKYQQNPIQNIALPFITGTVLLVIPISRLGGLINTTHLLSLIGLPIGTIQWFYFKKYLSLRSWWILTTTLFYTLYDIILLLIAQSVYVYDRNGVGMIADQPLFVRVLHLRNAVGVGSNEVFVMMVVAIHLLILSLAQYFLILPLFNKKRR